MKKRISINRLIQMIEATNEWVGKICSWGLYGIVIVVVVGVLARLTNYAAIWTFEVSLFIFGVIGSLGGGYGLLHGSHVTVDVLLKNLPERQKAILDICLFPIFFIFVFWLMWSGGEMALESILIHERSGSPWNPIIYPYRTTICIGAFLLLLQGFGKLYHDFVKAFPKKERPNEH